PENYCRAMYLNADCIARDCMKGRGYTFSDRDRGEKCRSSTAYGKAECYQPTWYVTAKQYFPLPVAWKYVPLGPDPFPRQAKSRLPQPTPSKTCAVSADPVLIGIVDGY